MTCIVKLNVARPFGVLFSYGTFITVIIGSIITIALQLALAVTDNISYYFAEERFALS